MNAIFKTLMYECSGESSKQLHTGRDISDKSKVASCTFLRVSRTKAYLQVYLHYTKAKPLLAEFYHSTIDGRILSRPSSWLSHYHTILRV